MLPVTMKPATLLRRRHLLSGSLAAFGSTRLGTAHAETKTVVIQPLGPASAELAVFAERALLAFYAVDIRVAPVLDLPRAAYYPARGRYRAERLLQHLDRAHQKEFRVLGLTEVDISTTKGNVADWGVLGLASMDGRACVLSAFRCRRSAKNRAHAIERLGKTAVHELGHTFGLEHCPNVGCLMEDGKGTVLTTDRETDLCSSCRKRLVERSLLHPDGKAPWQR
jgi:archaemetzincin